MANRLQLLGKSGEALAIRHLKKEGYRILAHNYRNRLGEIDIIAQDGDTIVFVEVKSRRTGSFGHPKLAVNPAKQRQISKVALSYLKQYRQLDTSARFDVVSILSAGNAPNIEIIKNAFDLAHQ
jgi:putative endonuclease